MRIHRLRKIEIFKQAMQERTRRSAARELMRCESWFFNNLTDACGIDIQSWDQILRDTLSTLLQTGITGHAPAITGLTLQYFCTQFAANSLRNLPGFTVRLRGSLASNIVAAKRFNRATQTHGIHRLAFLQQATKGALMHIGIPFFIAPTSYQRRNAKAAVPYRTG